MGVSLREEVRGAQFGDQRLTDRVAKIVDGLGAQPTLSIPAASRGRAEMEATYRFFDNPKVSPEGILQPHVEATFERIRQSNIALLVQDTTQLDLTRPKQQVEGTGPLEFESRRGAFFHPLIAFDDTGLPLGVAWQKSWVRDAIDTTLSTTEKRRRREKIPIEEKESIRWLEGLRAAQKVAEACGETRCVCISDSESDIYELFAEPRTTSAGQLHLLVRAHYDRVLSSRNEKWLAAVRRTECLYQCSVRLSGRTPKVNVETRKRRQQRDARIAELTIRATRVTLRPPYRSDRKLPEVTFNLVLAEETNPPEGETPIQWLLVTSLPIGNTQQVQQIVGYYCVRWQIEIFFRTLKSGCRIEERQFEKLDRVLNCLAVFAIVTWKIMYLCRLGRECPDLPCDVVLEPSEWKSVYMTVRHSTPPPTSPTLNEMIRMIASLGGYVDRKKTVPGTQTLWLGLQRVHDLSTGWLAFGPDTRKKFQT